MRMKNIKKRKFSNLNVLKLFGMIIIILIVVIINKSYAIYKLQKDFNVMKTKIGTFTSGDYQISVLVDGKEASTFPTYEDNYKVESVDCTNGVAATFDVENWRLAIDDMSSTSCKCTVSFNSKETNTTIPIAYSKKELIAMNDEIKNISAKELANYLYPVGSIYMSTEDDTVDKVQTKFGGTWVKYSEGTTLVGVNDSYTVNSTGGSSSVTLTNANLPEHNHSIPALSGTAASAGAHTHSMGYSSAVFDAVNGSSNWLTTQYAYYTNVSIKTGSSGAHTHDVTTKASSTNGCTNCSATDVNIQNPYTAVYMYKRTA